MRGIRDNKGESPFLEIMCTNPRKLIINKEEVTVKCGKCDTCKRQKSQEWAIKLINESKYHKEACFITLTFDNKILMDKNSKAVQYGAHPNFAMKIENSMKYFQKFIKRLRRKFPEKRISYFHIAEYGEKTHRPHHHAILFGVNFNEDRKEMEVSKTGHPQMYSETLKSLWACGRCTLQDCNSNNIIYIAQYSLKKFKNNIINKKYNTKMTFSNRCKMNVKFGRRHPELIEKGYLQDADGKRYKIPRSYLDNFKKEERGKYFEHYRKYEENLMEYFSNNNSNDIIKRQKIKEQILQKRNQTFNKSRDF